MKTYNFTPKYVEIALYKFDEIDECDYIHILELIDYFNSVEKYSLDFPTKFKFLTPYDREDEWYNELKSWLIDMKFFTICNKELHLSKRGKAFFKKLEKECLEIENTFSHYNVVRC